MSKFIPAEDAFKHWREDPEYVEAYDALEEEFTISRALIQARARAALTQEQLAEKIGTSQAQIAKLEAGHHLPSTRTLKRIADATDSKLCISFEPRHAVAC